MIRATTERVTESVTTATVQRRPDPSRGPDPSFTFHAPLSPRIQRSSLRVSRPTDPAEREAESVADKVVGSGACRAPVAISCAPSASGTPARSADASMLQSEMSGGSAMPASLSRSMGAKFGADFSGVRFHTDNRAAALSNRFSAQAFTVGSHVFFGRDAFQPSTPDGLRLVAHELTHTIQQGGVQQKASPKAASPAVSRTPVPTIQRLGISDALDYFADKANLIPGFRMLTILMGFNPINMSRVDRSAANILRAVIEFVPGGGLITQALDNHGIFEKAGAWVENQIEALGDIGSSIKQALDEFIDGLSWSDIFDLGDVWTRAKRIFTDPVVRIKDFVVGLVTGFVTLIKDAILKPIGALAKGTEGWNLLCAVLGKDPITGEAVPRDAETLIGGFLRLIGQGEVWENMKKANAIPRAFAWFKGAMADLVAFVSRIPSLFVQAFTSLELLDIVLLPKAFLKVGKVFGGFLLQFASWAGNAIWNLLEIIFDCVSPGTWGYIKKTGAALKTILRNPLPFMKNLIKAGIGGFDAFKKNFVPHLQAGLIDWLTGSLPGVYIPKSFALKELVTFVLSVLGISWQMIRAKLVKVIGEPAMVVLERTFDIVVTLVRDGPAAAWEKIKEEIGNLKEMVVDGIISMVTGLIVQKAVPKLIAMFIPGAGFISAILAIYDTIMVFVQKIAKIIQVVTAFVNSIVAIAAGNIGAAVAKVESVLAGLLGLAINFLMGFAGLGKIAEKVMGVITKIRAKVDAAIDKVIAWIVKMGKALFAKAKQAAASAFEWWKSKAKFKTKSGDAHTLHMRKEGARGRLIIESTPTIYENYISELSSRQPSLSGDVPALLDQARKVDSMLVKMTDDIQKSPAPSAATATQAASNKKIYDMELNKLATMTLAALNKLSIVEESTPVVFGGLSSGYGTSAFVDKLTTKHQKGQESTSAPGFARWDILVQRYSGNSPYYVRGHLLNNNLGGPAQWVNLTPITQAANNRSLFSMYHTFEKGVKDAKNGLKTGESLQLRIEAKYGGRSIPNVKASPLVRNIRSEEKLIPTTIKCFASKRSATGQFTPLYNVTTANVVDTAISHYHLAPQVRTIIHLGTASLAELQNLEGVGPTEALAIENAGKKQTPRLLPRDVFVADPTLGATLWHKIVSTAGYKIMP